MIKVVALARKNTGTLEYSKLDAGTATNMPNTFNLLSCIRKMALLFDHIIVNRVFTEEKLITNQYRTIPSSTHKVDFLSDGTLVGLCDNGIVAVNLGRERQGNVEEEKMVEILTVPLYCIDISPLSSRKLAVLGKDLEKEHLDEYSIYIMEYSDNFQLEPKNSIGPLPPRIFSIGSHPSGELLAIVGDENIYFSPINFMATSYTLLHRLKKDNDILLPSDIDSLILALTGFIAPLTISNYNHEIVKASFSRDGNLIALGGGNKVYIASDPQNKLIPSDIYALPKGMAITSSSELIWGDDNTLLYVTGVSDKNSGRNEVSYLFFLSQEDKKPYLLTDERGSISRCALSADGKKGIFCYKDMGQYRSIHRNNKRRNLSAKYSRKTYHNIMEVGCFIRIRVMLTHKKYYSRILGIVHYSTAFICQNILKNLLLSYENTVHTYAYQPHRRRCTSRS